MTMSDLISRQAAIDAVKHMKCSVCKEIQYGYDSGRHFCANCGADMEDDK